MTKNFNKWFWLFVTIYFLLVMIFISFGFGKVISLMMGEGAWDYFKDFIEIVAYLATAGSLMFAVFLYQKSEKEKKIIAAWNSLTEIKLFFHSPVDLPNRKLEIIYSFHKLDSWLIQISSHDAEKIKEDRKIFCASQLRQLKLHHVFPVRSDDVDEINCWNYKNEPADLQYMLPKFISVLKKNDYAPHNLIDREESALKVIELLILYGEKEAYAEYTYLDARGDRYWKDGLYTDERALCGDLDLFSVYKFGLTVSAILYLSYFGKERKKYLNS